MEDQVVVETTIKTHRSLLDESEAVFSTCQTYRYRLTRTWDASLPSIAYLMLNPSTADEMKNDPTIERCQRRALSYGFGCMVIINLFPYRETDSSLLSTIECLYGDQALTDQHILDVVAQCKICIAGWGSHPLAMERGRVVYAMLEKNGLADRLLALEVNGDGNPRHPLYIPYESKPKAWAPIRENK